MRTKLVFHLYFRSLNLPLVRLRTEPKDGRFVTFGHRVLEVRDETGRLLGVVVYKLGKCIELVFCCYVQLKTYTQHQSHHSKRLQHTVRPSPKQQQKREPNYVLDNNKLISFLHQI